MGPLGPKSKECPPPRTVAGCIQTVPAASTQLPTPITGCIWSNRCAHMSIAAAAWANHFLPLKLSVPICEMGLIQRSYSVAGRGDRRG